MSDPVASEKAAELAKAEKLELVDVKGTGKDGLIKIDDVRQAVAERKAKEDAAAAASSSSSSEASSSSPTSTRDDAGAEATEAKAAAPRSSKMPERSHLEGCPINADRIEVYEQRVPPKRNSDGMIAEPARMATMAHCCDCGATTEIKA